MSNTQVVIGDQAQVDPVLSQVIYNYELTLNGEMGRAVVNLSGSPMFVGAADFACACLDADGNTITNISWSLQMGYAISNTVKTSLRRYKDNLHPGDMIFCNDPYEGGGLHSSDVVMVTPIFHDDELLMWVGVCAHVTDVGGAVPGSFSVKPMECYGENVRFTPVKFYDRGEFKQDIVDAFLTNVRLEDRTGIDLKAMMGANWIGRDRMLALIDRYGSEQVATIHASQIAQSAREMRKRLSQIPDGVYEGAAHMEHDGDDDVIYTIRVSIIKEDNEVTFDFSETDDQAKGVLNCAEVGTSGNVVAAIGTVLAPDIPFNEGLMHPVKIISRPGTLVHATKPAPIAGATVYAAWFGTDACLEALNYAIAGNSDTQHRRTGPWACWTWSFLHTTNQYGDPWMFIVFTGGAGGAGAMPFRDGEPAMLGIQINDAFTANIEDYEIQSPVLFLNRRFSRDTGGAGLHRGGLALESMCIPWGTDQWEVSVNHNRLSAPSSSVSGGFPGSGSVVAPIPNISDEVLGHWQAMEELPIDEYMKKAEPYPARGAGYTVLPEDGYYIRATGGPGYGDPLQRDVSRVLKDVEHERVSVEMASAAYGVVITDTAVDEDATDELRAALIYARKKLPLTKKALAEGLHCPTIDIDPVPLTESQSLGEYLAVTPEGQYECRKCSHQYCGNNANWKMEACFVQSEVCSQSIKNIIQPRPQGDLVFRQYFCPACGVQADIEVSLNEEAPRWNFKPLAVWKTQNIGAQ
jgi:N-methylhydantoinase B|tara:strand:- start:132 stop:2375 length:2244 start_codon:yes stop_codon:yes gene_type:complete